MRASEWIRLFAVTATANTLLAQADYVELRDGSRVEGTILSEGAKTLDIETSSNEAGTIRKILRIDYGEISAWSAEAADRTSEEPHASDEILGIMPGEVLEDMISKGEAAVAEREFDKALQIFRRVVEVADNGVTEAKTLEEVESLETKANAYVLLKATLEGKIEVLEQRLEDGEERLDELDDRERALQKAWKELKDDVEDAKKKREDDGKEVRRLGSRYSRTDLQAREAKIREDVRLLKSRRAEVKAALEKTRNDSVALGAEVKLVDERADQAEDRAKDARKMLRKRR